MCLYIARGVTPWRSIENFSESVSFFAGNVLELTDHLGRCPRPQRAPETKRTFGTRDERCRTAVAQVAIGIHINKDG